MSENNEITNIRTVLQIDNELIDNITDLIESGAEKSLLNIFTDLHPADIAEIINHLDLESAKYTFSILDTETAGEVITEIDENYNKLVLTC